MVIVASQSFIGILVEIENQTLISLINKDGCNPSNYRQQSLHKGHQPVGCQAKAKAFRNMRSSFGNKRVESRCKDEAQRLEL